MTDAQRHAAKGLAYAILYGKGARRVAIDLACSLEAAQRFVASFRTSLDGVVRQRHSPNG